MVRVLTATLRCLIKVFGLCTCDPEGLTLEWSSRELKPNLIFKFFTAPIYR